MFYFLVGCLEWFFIKVMGGVSFFGIIGVFFFEYDCIGVVYDGFDCFVGFVGGEV